jgi:hypothetical protein
MAETFKEKVTAVNKLLEGYGNVAITSHDKGKGENKKTYTGYKIQYVVDAVNEIIGAENWRWEATSLEAERNPSGLSSTANIAVTVYIRVDGEWLSKGPVTGDSLNPEEASAMKGALADGLKKAFGYWSIGNKAYRGELVLSNSQSKPPTKPESAPKSKTPPEAKSKYTPPKVNAKAEDTGPSSDLFTSLNDEIKEAEKPGLLNEVGERISRAIADGKMPKGEGAILQARYERRLKDLKNQ